MFISLVRGAEQVRSEKLRAYGVTSEKRQLLFPDLPAIGETVPGFESVAWFGVFGPAKLPMRLPKNSTLSLSLRLQNRNCAIN